MKLIIVSIAILLTSSSYSSDLLLQQYCLSYGGELQKKYTCPKSKLTFSFGFCVYRNKDNIEQFFDGCTGPSGGFEKSFYPHCIKHDLCYHHEPISNNKAKSQCDQEFLDGLLLACQREDNVRKCEKWAHTLYRAVNLFGRLAFNCANYKAEY